MTSPIVPNEYSADRQDQLVRLLLSAKAIDDPEIGPYWREVTVQTTKGEFTFACACDALQARINVDGIGEQAFRVPVSARDSQRLCDAWGLIMPTPKLLDLAWQSSKRVPMVVLGHAANMANLDQSILFTKRVAAEMAKLGLKRGDPLGPLAKNWGLDAGCTPSHACNHGLYYPSGKPEQEAGHWHDIFHTDWSQYLDWFANWYRLNGKEGRLSDLYQDPELCSLVGLSKPLPFARQPGIGRKLPPNETSLAPEQVARAIAEAYFEIVGQNPTRELVLVLTAHSALETGHWHLCRNYNLGNVKATDAWQGDYSYYYANEKLPASLLAKALRFAAWRLDGKQGLDAVATGGGWVDLFPDHPWCRFRAYSSLKVSVADHIRKLMGRYKAAIPFAARGDVVIYCSLLQSLGPYFTANLGVYTNSVDSIYRGYSKLSYLSGINNHHLAGIASPLFLFCGEIMAERWEQLVEKYPPISKHIAEREIPFIEAKGYEKRIAKKKRIIIHTTENVQSDKVAENIAMKWHLTKSVSCHFIVGSELAIQCVPESAVAWHAVPDNDESIGIELVGRHTQTWDSDFAIRQLELAAQLAASLASTHAIPIVRGTIADLPHTSGVWGHSDVTKAYNVVGGHIDPGPNFPWAKFLPACIAWQE
jgi:N-acetyl-anhydromuramyl-L-alanine amidase AmpD